jgi:hypothetical protein
VLNRFFLKIILPVQLIRIGLLYAGGISFFQIYGFHMTNKNSSPNDTGRPITDDAIFKVAKEVVVKFIEVGRLSPDSFSERFENIYSSIKKTVQNNTTE